MRYLHIVQDGSEYLIRDMRFVSKDGLIIYLKARGITAKYIKIALEKLQRSGRRLKPWWVSSAKIRHSGKVQCFSVKEGSYASPLA